MRNPSLLLMGMLGIALFSASCRNIRTLTDKDHSATAGQKKSRSKRSPEFLDGISTSGAAVAGNNTAAARKKPAANLPSPAPQKIENTFFLTNVNLEKVDPIQLRYAIRMDATVERVLNLPLLQQIDHWWGTRYCIGGNSTNCVDCSGFTTAVMRDVFKVSVPRTSQEQYQKSDRVGLADLKEGDLVFFAHSGGQISHVGIYLTNNKFVHASTSQGVIISDLSDAYWAPKFYGAGRMPGAVAAN